MDLSQRLMLGDGDDGEKESPVDAKGNADSKRSRAFSGDWVFLAQVEGEDMDILRAAAMIDIGAQGVLVEPDAINPWYCRLYSNLQSIRFIFMLVFLSVNIFEQPSWCGRDTDGPCGVQGRNYMYFGLSSTDKDNSAEMTIDTLCILVLLAISYVKLRAYGWKHYVRSVSPLYVSSLLLALIVSSIDTARGYCVIPTAIVRPLAFILATHKVRDLVLTVVSVIPRVSDVLLFLSMNIAFFAILGVFIFRDRIGITQGESSDLPTSEGSRYFNDFADASVNMFILFTTANNPNVMLPAYTENRAYVLFFVAFIVLTIFFLGNVILATVYDQYRVALEKQAREFAQNRACGIAAAYQILVRSLHDQARPCPDSIPRDVIFQLFSALQTFRSVAMTSKVPVEAEDSNNMLFHLIFVALDRDNSGVLSWEEFQRIPQAMQLKFRSAPGEEPMLSPLGATAPPEAGWRATVERWRVWLKPIFLSWQYELCACLVVCINFIVMVVELEKPGQLRNAFVGVEMMFTTIFLLEACLILYCLKPKRYFHSWRRRWQITSSAIAFVVEIYLFSPDVFNDSEMLRYIIVVRMLRLFWILYEIPRFKKLFRALYSLLDPFLIVLSLLCLVLAVYASLGVHAFGGTIWVDNPDIVANAQEYARDGYWPLNFNDFSSAYVMLFQLLVVNNWYILMEGTVAAVGSRWARAYFLVFYLIGVIIVLNIVVAVMLTLTKSVKAEDLNNRRPIYVLKMDEQDERNQKSSTRRKMKLAGGINLGSRPQFLDRDRKGARSLGQDDEGDVKVSGMRVPMQETSPRGKSRRRSFVIEAWLPKRAANMNSLYNVFGIEADALAELPKLDEELVPSDAKLQNLEEKSSINNSDRQPNEVL